MRDSESQGASWRPIIGASRPGAAVGSEFPWALLEAEQWMADALCAQVGTDEWFPEKGGTTLPAKAVCASCDVRAQCLQYALEHGERYGIWGGLSEKERRRLVRAGGSA